MPGWVCRQERGRGEGRRDVMQPPGCDTDQDHYACVLSGSLVMLRYDCRDRRQGKMREGGRLRVRRKGVSVGVRGERVRRRKERGMEQESMLKEGEKVREGFEREKGCQGRAHGGNSGVGGM